LIGRDERAQRPWLVRSPAIAHRYNLAIIGGALVLGPRWA
jgi:hypothetical protein